MALTILNAAHGPRDGLYVGGFNIAPRCYLIRAQSFNEAWEVMIEAMADAGQLAPCDHDSERDEECDSHDWVDGHGPMVTCDVVLAVARRSASD